MNIISEAATNHFGSLPLMWELVQESLGAGASFVKFQTIDTDKLYASGEYTYGDYDIHAVRWLRRHSEISPEHFKECVTKCIDRYGNNAITTTPFDLQSLEMLAETNPPFIKIASGDNNYLELVDAAASSGCKIVLSTGMSDLSQIDIAVNTVLNRTSDIVLMHCVAEYPHSLENAMLGTIPLLKARYGVEIGYSDHTIGTEAAVIAASMGVTWFEKHFTLSRNNGGLDAKHSMEPSQLSAYCSALQQVHSAVSGVRKEPSDAERYTAQRARRGIYYRQQLKAGTTIGSEHLVFVRPEKEYSLEQIDQVIGRTIKQDVEADSPVATGDF